MLRALPPFDCKALCFFFLFFLLSPFFHSLLPPFLKTKKFPPPPGLWGAPPPGGGHTTAWAPAGGPAAVARAHMNEVKRRLKEEKNAKDEDVLVSLQLVNEMLVRGYEFLPIELGKSRGSSYIVEDGKVRLPFSSLKGLGGAAADALEKATLDGQEYLSIEELQQASGVSNAILDRLRQVGALGDLPESSQVSFF